MQKQIFVPFATAIIAQTAHALTLQDHLNQSGQMSASPLELAQLEIIDEVAECKDSVARQKQGRIQTCQKKKNERKKQQCLVRVDKWEKVQLLKCIPCDQKVLRQFEVKLSNCQKKQKPRQRERCIANQTRWRDNRLKQCSPIPVLCESVAKYEREKQHMECDKIEDPETKNQCKAEADKNLKEDLEECACKEDADNWLKPRFEACEEIADSEDKEDCLEEAQAKKDQMYQRCEGLDFDCYELAHQEYREFIEEECQNITNPNDKEQCYQKADQILNEQLQVCQIDECREGIHQKFEEKFEYCNGLDSPDAVQQCHWEYDAALIEALKECDPQPLTCWEEAKLNYTEAMDQCVTYEDGEEKENCQKSAEEAYNQHAEQCQIEDCYDGQEAEMAAHFEKCHAMTEMEDKEGCLKEAEALLQQLKEENCHPKPTCWEEAQAFYDEYQTICAAIPDPESQTSCYAEIKAQYESQMEQCQIGECYDEVEASMAPQFETCHAMWAPEEKEACLKEAEAILAERQAEICDPQPTCEEVTKEHYKKEVDECYNTTDQSQVDACVRAASENYLDMLDECRIMDCIANANTVHEPRFKECDMIDDPEKHEKCLDVVNQSLQEMTALCYPTCWEKALKYKERVDANCSVLPDNEREGCYKESQEVYNQQIQDCEISECVEKVTEIYEEKFEQCESPMQTPEDQEKCRQEVEAAKQKALEECDPIQMTCFDEAKTWLSDTLQQCEGDASVDLEQCRKDAMERYELWVEDCELGECIESVKNELLPMYNECHATYEEGTSDHALCVEKVDRRYEVMVQQCYPTPPTCSENARESYESEVQNCQSNTDQTATEMDQCISDAKQLYKNRLVDCEVEDCYLKARTEMAPQFDTCNGLTDSNDKESCLASANEILETMLKECQPQNTDQVDTSCGLVDVDDRLDNFNKLQLDAHNEYRAFHQAKPLAYNHDIAVEAQKYAQWMFDNDKFQHSDRTDRDGQGENLYWSTWPGMEERSDATDSWYKEVEIYDYANPGFSSGTGHFTQVVWKSSCQLGCGQVGAYVVCRYSPAGNWAGEYEENVKQAQAM